MMEGSNVGTFIADVNQLVYEYEHLKKHTQHLMNENKRLKNQNLELIEKNDIAKDTIIKIIDRLKEVQA